MPGVLQAVLEDVIRKKRVILHVIDVIESKRNEGNREHGAVCASAATLRLPRAYRISSPKVVAAGNAKLAGKIMAPL